MGNNLIFFLLDFHISIYIIFKLVDKNRLCPFWEMMSIIFKAFFFSSLVVVEENIVADYIKEQF